ncbi:MAG: YihA family ribosome biogenesis GTP-binding protein [Ruminococcaceae bacterium]|nr:YihA family ribosome biogenesis GTP-binding protein [Oscillospiraceae bacterium]
MKLEKASFEAAAGTAKQLPRCTVPEVVFAGRSNVGKSSLINKVLNRKSLARVSSQPGKTATINFYDCDGAKLVDLPGYGYAKVSQSEKNRWSQLIDGYFAQNRDIRLVVMLVDSRHKPSKDDLTMLDFLEESGLPTLIALTKVDKLNKTERTNRLAALPDELGCDEEMLLPFSSVTGEGAEQLREILYQVAADEEE